MVGVGEVAVAVGTGGWQLGSAGESKLCHTLGLDTWSKCGCWWVGWSAKRQAGRPVSEADNGHMESTHTHTAAAHRQRERDNAWWVWTRLGQGQIQTRSRSNQRRLEQGHTHKRLGHGQTKRDTLHKNASV